MQRFLLLPMQPTPNGRLHLGHIAGPYLQCDILARLLRKAGYSVNVICGSDAYENWVLLPARLRKSDPKEYCDEIDALIQMDLASVDVEFDCWINPISSAHADGYSAANNSLLSDLIGANQVELRREKVPYSPVLNGPAMGVWLRGRCPSCDQSVSGNCCEYCGSRFEPEEIIEADAREGYGPLVWKTGPAWFAKYQAFPEYIDGVRKSLADKTFLDLVQSFFDTKPYGVRLTSHGDWGIKNVVDENGEIVANTFYGYCLYCADIFATANNVTNPLRFINESTSVLVFTGVDNLVAAAVVPQVLSRASDKLRPFDTVFLNRFLDLEGEKFSTSRNIGVWVADLAGVPGVSSDDIRIFIASLLDNTSNPDFSADAFFTFRQGHRDLLSHRLLQFKKSVQFGDSSPPSVYKSFVPPLDGFSVQSFSPKDLFQRYWKLLDSTNLISSDPVSWMQHYLFLCEVLAPRLAKAIMHWIETGHSDQLPIELRSPILRSQLDACIRRGNQ